jgi:hypothetical protein
LQLVTTADWHPGSIFRGTTKEGNGSFHANHFLFVSCADPLAEEHLRWRSESSIVGDERKSPSIIIFLENVLGIMNFNKREYQKKSRRIMSEEEC